MPEITQFKPHAISCIKDSVCNLLQQNTGDNLTVVCDRDDCWNDDELFKWRQAINIVTRDDSVGEATKSPRLNTKLGDKKSEADLQCYHEATLNIDIQVYVCMCDCDTSECGCMDVKSKAYAILGHITHILTSQQSQILGKRILYSGSDFQQDTENEDDLVAVTGRFQISYLFDQTRPWVVGN